MNWKRLKKPLKIKNNLLFLSLWIKIKDMDFQNLVDMYEMAAAVLSVEKTEDGHWGEIRIVRANLQYKQIMGPNYRDDMIYSELIPKELNFEDFCFRCAVNKQHLHSYVDTKSMGLWTDATYIPLSKSFDTDKLCYFIFYLVN